MASPTTNNERTNRSLAVIITLLIHAGILLFLLYYIIVTPIPPYPETKSPELVVDFGGGGGGGSSAATATTNRTNNAEETHNKVATTTVANTPTVNSQAEPSTPIPSEKAIKPSPKVDTVAKPQQPSVELVTLENKFKNAKASGGGGASQGGSGSGIGSGHGSGNGTGTGSGSGSGNGGGEGGGFGYDLKGRGILKRPELSTNNPEQGKIVVGITVDQDGNVIEATPGMVGSTITDASLYILVKNAAMKIKFTKSPNDSPEQSGTVTFRFTIR